MYWKKAVTKSLSGTTTLSEKRPDSGCEVCQLKSKQDIRLRIYHGMFAQRCSKRGIEMLFFCEVQNHFKFPQFQMCLFVLCSK